MKRVIQSLLMAIITLSAYASGLVAEQVTSQKAVYNEAEGYVKVSGITPSYSEYDWETYIQEPLSYISYILIERHTPSTSWGSDAEIGRIENPQLDAEFEFIDRNVVPDSRYEYRITCYIDDTRGSSSYANVYTGITPCAVTNFTATTTDCTSTTVNMSVTAPTTSVSGTTLTSPMTIVIQSYEDWTYSDLHTIEDVQPGATCTWQHEGLELNKSYHYRALAMYGSSGVGEGLTADVYVGMDVPGAPRNLVCTPTDETATVALQWEAPLIGARGGSFSPETTTYKIYRQYFGEDAEVIASNIADTSYNDVTGFSEETMVTYSVLAVNEAGEGYDNVTAPSVSVGMPAEMPFKESFSDAIFTHKGWTMQTTQDDPYYTYEAWHLRPSSRMYSFPIDDYIDIEPQDNDGGFIVCYFYGYSEDGQTESLTSPRINVNNVTNPQLTFHFFDVSSEIATNLVSAAVSADGGEWQTLFTSEPKEDTETGWRQVVLPLSLPEATETIRVRLQAIRAGLSITDIHIDNIAVEAGSSAIPAVNSDTTTNATTEYFNLQGMRVNHPENGELYIRRQGNKVDKILMR